MLEPHLRRLNLPGNSMAKLLADKVEPRANWQADFCDNHQKSLNDDVRGREIWPEVKRNEWRERR